MNKSAFLEELRKSLKGVPPDELNGRLSFYGEIIDDKVEEGASEEEAVADLGNVKKVVSQVLSEVPFSKILKERIKPKRRLKPWETLLLILGAPLWFPILTAVAAGIFSLYIAAWSVIISLWAALISLPLCALGSIAAAAAYAVKGMVFASVAVLGTTFFLAGLSLLGYYAVLYVTKAFADLTKKTAVIIKNRFVGKERL